MRLHALRCDMCNVESIEGSDTSKWSRWGAGQITGRDSIPVLHYTLDVCPECWQNQPRQGVRAALAIVMKKLKGAA